LTFTLDNSDPLLATSDDGQTTGRGGGYFVNDGHGGAAVGAYDIIVNCVNG
jgi:hypothetical protein